MTTTRKRTPATNGNGKPDRTEQFAILSNTLHRLNQARLWGEQYGGDRRIQEVGGYKATLSFGDFAGVYQRDPIAARLVDMIPEDTWREPPEVVEAVEDREEDADATKFEAAWQELSRRLGVWRKFERADRLGRLGRYSVILIGAGAGDDAALERPLTSATAADVLYLSCYDEQHAPIQRWVTNPQDPRFGLPELYNIDLTSSVQSFNGGERMGPRLVHHSRVLHIAEGLSSDEVYGRPALERVWNALHDLQKVSTSTAEGFWQRVAGILVASIDGDAAGVGDLIAQLDQDLQAIFHDLRRYVVSSGVDLKRLAETEPNPSEAAKLYFTLIAAGEGIPFRMLVGNETGERASTEDSATYLGNIAGRQKQHAEPTFVRAFVDRLQGWGALPRVEYEVNWPPLFEESALEKADANLKRAQTAVAITPVGGDPNLIIEIDAEGNIKLLPREAGEKSPFEDMLEEQKQMERDAMEQALAPADEGGPAAEAA